MITFSHHNTRFTYRIAAVALHEGNILLNKLEGDSFWFLPGGRAELLEPSHQTLKREMREELGTETHIERLLWIIENFFTLGETHHELGLYFLVNFPPASHLYQATAPFPGQETATRLTFQWHPLTSLQNINLQPAFLRSALNAIPATTEHIVHIDTNTSTQHIQAS